MNQSSNAPMIPPASSSGMAGWFQVWMKVVTKPSEQTFAEIISSPDATTQNAFIWAAVAGFVNGLVAGIVVAIQTVMRGGDLKSSAGILLAFICGIPIASAILTPLFFGISAGLTQWVAKMFGGTGSFEKLAFALASILVPIGLISSVINLFGVIPFVGLCFRLVGALVGFYSLYLSIMATKVVNRFDWGKAAGSVLIPVAVLFLCICVIIGGMMAMGVGAGALSSFGNGQFSP